MKSRNLIILFLAFFFLNAKAQLADEIKNYVDSTEIMFNNGRKMLIHSLTERDLRKSEKIYFYLKDESAKKNCVAFNFWEEQSILAIHADWITWLDRAEKINEISSNLTCYNFSERLNERLYKIEHTNLYWIKREIATLNIDAEQKDLLELYLINLSQGADNKEYIDKYNSYSKKYKKKSRYYAFINAYFPPVVPDASMIISLGPTFVRMDGVLGTMFSTGTVFNMAYDFNIGNIYTSFFVNGGMLPVQIPFFFTNSKTKEDTSFAVGDKFSYANVGLAGGYYLVRTNYFKLAPYIAIGGYNIESNMYSEKSEKQEIGLVNSFYVGPGLHTEVKIFEYKMNSNSYLYGGFDEQGASLKSYLSIRLDIGYDIITKHIFPTITGNSSYMKLGLIWSFGGF